MPNFNSIKRLVKYRNPWIAINFTLSQTLTPVVMHYNKQLDVKVMTTILLQLVNNFVPS